MAQLLSADKVAFLTGAGSGIGQQTAYTFVKHGLRKLALSDINAEGLKRTQDEIAKLCPEADVLTTIIDTSKEQSVEEGVAASVKHFGRIDIAVNCAGIAVGAVTDDHTLDDWRKVLSVNLDGVWLSQRAQIKQMLTQESLDPAPRGNRGVIVNIASMLGLIGASPDTAAVAYTASKHGVMGMTRTDAIMYAPHGIRINAICPGYIDTPMLGDAEIQPVIAEEVKKCPQQRMGTMEEVADCITFLASPMSSFMAGTGLTVDGGFTAGRF